MNEKEIVLQLAKEKYKTAKVSKYYIGSVAGTCLVDAFIEIRGYVTWGNLRNCWNAISDSKINCPMPNYKLLLRNYK